MRRCSTTIASPVRLGAAALACGAWLAGCGVSMPDPTVQAVVPDRAWNGEDTVVTITGQRFYPQIALDAARRGEADLDQGFAAWLLDDEDPDVRFALSGVSSLGTRSLRGIVDAGLPPGEYDLLVVGPTGRSDRLPSAFTVSDQRGDRLVLEPEQVIGEVNQWTAVDLTLRDPGGERVLDDLSVTVSAVFHGGDTAQVEFGGGGWEGSEPVVSGLSGPLGPDGAASFAFKASVPGTYTLTARALDVAAAVRSAAVDVQVEPARALGVVVELPEDDFTGVAGDGFEVDLRLVDVYGNPMPHATAQVALQNRCGGWMDFVQVQGEATITARIDRATGADCPLDALVTHPTSEASGASAPFRIQPGPLEAFHVHVFMPSVVAGQALDAFVDPVDAFGNSTPYGGGVTLVDSVGGVGPTPCVLAETGGLCAVTPTIAGEQVVLEARASGGVLGISAPYAVLPEPVVGGIDVGVPDQVVAGRPFAAEVAYRDRFGNALDAADFALGVVADDELGEADCETVGYTIQGTVQVRCRTFTARDGARMFVKAGALVDESEPFRVHNGNLEQVDVTGPGQVTAGQPFVLSLAGFDAWGNPYLRQDDPQLVLDDTSGTITPAGAALGPAGTAAVQVTLTQSGPTVVRVWQDGVILGTSTAWVVQPGVSETLRVTPQVPWAWTTVPTPVHVEAVDAWGNRTSVSGVVTLASRYTPAPAQAVTLVDGLGTGWFTYGEPVATDVLEASLPGSLQGESAPLHVVEDCGDEGPTAELDFGGHPEAIACFDPVAGKATVSVSLAGSDANGVPLSEWLVHVPGQGTVASAQPQLLLDIFDIGGHHVDALVVRDDLCADVTSSRAWVGPDDGSPVGPITLVPAEPVLDAGAGSTQVVVRDVVDCSRDVAADAKVRVRAEVGTIVGAQPTGTGLSVALDATAQGVFTLDVATARSPGPAAIHAWSESGAAEGRVEIEIEQDLQRPVVLEQTPAGHTFDWIDEVRLVFSEPLREEDVTEQRFGVYGPHAVTVYDARLENGGTEVVLELEPAVDGSLGLWTVHASQAVRDLAGNRLAGQWSELPLAYNGYFGHALSSLEAVACLSVSPYERVFRPDGDAGDHEDAERVEISVGAGSVPHWWRMTVTEAHTGAWVLRRREIPHARFDQLAWDGRDQSGRVVDNGHYVVEIAPLDGVGNTGPACEVDVEVANGPAVPR